VQEKRDLLWWWDVWNEAAWIWVWSLLGGSIAWLLSKPWHLAIGTFLSTFVIYFCCMGIFLLSGWIPFIPAFFSFFITEFILSLWLKNYQKNKS
jgi:CHASE2 domain-containing sensor protein